MNKEQPVRKSVRERVADRKRGIKEERPISERKQRFLKVLRIVLLTSQYVGLLLLLLSLGGIVTENYEIKNGNLIVVYCAMFLIGRFGITVIKSFASFR